MAGAAGFDAGEGVLVDGSLLGWCGEHLGGSQVSVGRGLALEVLALGDDAVDLGVEGLVQPRRVEHLRCVAAGGDDGELLAGGARRVQVLDRAGVGLDPVVVDEPAEEVVFAGGDALDEGFIGWDVLGGQE